MDLLSTTWLGRSLGLGMLLQQMPNQPRCARAALAFGVELGLHGDRYLDHYSHHLHGASHRQLHASNRQHSMQTFIYLS